MSSVPLPSQINPYSLETASGSVNARPKRFSNDLGTSEPLSDAMARNS